MSDLAGGLKRAFVLGAAGSIAELTRAGLRDRDYENLLTGERLAAHAGLTGEGKRLVCDCADSEPEVQIAALLSAGHAGRVVEGALIAAFAAATPAVVFHLAQSDRPGADALACALAEGCQATARLAPPGAVFPPAVEIVQAPFRRNLKGYEDVPTLVVNAETLLGIARVLAEGADAYCTTGCAGSPGTKWFHVSGRVKRPGIYELPLGVGLRHLVEEVCGGVAEGETLQAVVVGGARGSLYRPEELAQPLDFDSAAREGGTIGSGAVTVLGERDCVIDHTRQSLAFSCYDACGACALGREGSYQLREIVADITRGKSRPGDLELLREIGEAMKIGCACAAGRTAANLVLSGLGAFAEEYEAHAKRKRCRALVCAKYVTFHILPDLCDGCGACAEECPEDAIAGGRKKIHVIDQDDCTQCGRCYEVCLDLQKAVVKAGPVKPRTPKRPIPVGSWEG